MRNLLIGIFIGSALTAGVGVSASLKGPQVKGESGPIKYSIIVEGEIVCSNPWVSVPQKTIECYSEPPDAPADNPMRNIAE